MAQELTKVVGELGCSYTSASSDPPVINSPSSSSSTGTGFGRAPPNPNECTSAAVESSSTSQQCVLVGPFVFNEERLRMMELLAKPDAPGGADESRDRSKSARKALANSGRRPTSSFKGVNLHCRSNRWETHIWDGHQVHVGCFDTELQAAIAYDIVAIKLRGAKAKLNFTASSYQAEGEVLEKMSRDEVLMAMRGVTFKEEPAGGDSKARDTSPPRTRKNARQAARASLEAVVNLPRKRRKTAKHAAAELGATAAKQLAAARSSQAKVPSKLHHEINHLSEPEGRWPAPAPKITTQLPYQVQNQTSLVVPDSPTLVHPYSSHPSDLIVNHQSTIWTTQDTCSLLPSHWLSHASAKQSMDNTILDDYDDIGHSGSALSSDTDFSDDLHFEYLDQSDLPATATDDAEWQTLDFSPGMLLLEPDYAEPMFHGA